MARITSYATLQSAIADLVVYAGDVTTGDFDTATMVQMCEATLRRELRHTKMITRSIATLDTRTFAVPTGWVEGIRLAISVGAQQRALQLASLDELFDRRTANNDVPGVPCLYAIVGEEFEVWPQPDADYTVEHLHYAFPTELSDIAPTNWILTYLPDLYLYGSLITAEIYNKSDERIPVWTAMFRAALNEANKSTKQAAWSGTGMRVRFR